MLAICFILNLVQGLVVQSPIVDVSCYIVCPSVLRLNNLKLHNTWQVKDTFIQEKLKGRFHGSAHVQAMTLIIQFYGLYISVSAGNLALKISCSVAKT